MKFTQNINLKTRYILFSETLQIRKGSHRFQQIMWNQAYIHIFTLYLFFGFERNYTVESVHIYIYKCGKKLV